MGHSTSSVSIFYHTKKRYNIVVENMGTGIELSGYLAHQAISNTSFTNYVTLGKLLNLKSSVFLSVQ